MKFVKMECIDTHFRVGHWGLNFKDVIRSVLMVFRLLLLIWLLLCCLTTECLRGNDHVVIAIFC